MTDDEIFQALGLTDTEVEALCVRGPTAAQEAQAEVSFTRQVQQAVSAAINNTPTAEAAARAVYAALCILSAKSGQNPNIEVWIESPAQSVAKGRPHGACWIVSWESGPYQWAIGASLGGHNRLTEPYYSFDLTFYPGEWPNAE